MIDAHYASNAMSGLKGVLSFREAWSRTASRLRKYLPLNIDVNVEVNIEEVKFRLGVAC